MSQLRPITRLGALKPSTSKIKLLSPLAQICPFSSTPQILAKPLPPRLKLDDADLSIAYLKGTGPGGQKINKTNSAVQISHKPSGIVIKCQATRSQSQNEKIARSLLADRVEAQLKGDQSRVALKAEAARKKKASKVKKAKRKYRGLEKEMEGEGDVDVDVDAQDDAAVAVSEGNGIDGVKRGYGSRLVEKTDEDPITSTTTGGNTSSRRNGV